MLGMNQAAVERFTKMMQLQAEKPVGELVAGSSFTGMEWEKAWPHQSALDVWSYFRFLGVFFENLRSREHRSLNSPNSKGVNLCASRNFV